MIAGCVNPCNSKAKEVYRTVECPKQKKRIKELEAQLETVLNAPKEVEIRETIKEVVKEDSSLVKETVEKLNSAYREIAELRGKLEKRPFAMQSELKPQIRTEIKEVVKEIPRLVFVANKKLIAISALAAATIGLFAGALLF